MSSVLENRRALLIGALIMGAIFFIGRFTPFGPIQGFFEIFRWVTEKGIEIAKHLFEEYGYLTVFLAPMLENTLFVGALIPGTLVMLLAGISAYDEIINIYFAIPIAVAGAIVGDTISYSIGRFGRGRMGPESRIAGWSEQMREPLMKHSLWLVLSYHFAGYSRLIGPAAAGFLQMPFLRWALLDYAGVAIWATTFIVAGYILGALGLSLDDSDRTVQVFEIALFVFFIIGVLTILRTTSRAVSHDREHASPKRMEAPVAAGGSNGEPEDEG
jgi:membrane protein DedA with SNARE-associated domain